MKKLKTLLLILTLIIVPLSLAGCSLLADNSATTRNSVERIAKTSTDGLVDTYTIYYTDGSTSQFEITNGKDGQKGENGADGQTDIYEIWETYCEKTDSDISFEDFVEQFLKIDTTQDNTKVINECLLSAVKLCCEFDVTITTRGVYYNFINNSTVREKDTTYFVANRGSGIIYKMTQDGDTYIITNYHVTNFYTSLSTGQTLSNVTRKKIVGWLYGCGGTFESSADGTSLVYDGYEIEMEYVGGSAEADIAILKVPTADILEKNSQAKAVKFASDYYVGETAIAIGNPEDAGISATQGIVSVHDEYVPLSVDGTIRDYRSLRYDTSIYSGSSGGGLFNKKGELIGITNAGWSTDQSINWAIPVQIATGVANSIIEQDEAGKNGIIRAQVFNLGITDTNTQNSTYIYYPALGYGRIEETVYAKTVVNFSVAKSLGISAGDEIVAITINGQRHVIYQDFILSDLLLTIRVGDQISMEYRHNGASTISQTHTVKANEFEYKA